MSEIVSEILRLENVSRHFSGLRALNGVTLAVNKGDVLGLIGPDTREIFVFLVDAILVPPRGEDVQALPVFCPAGGRFVEAAVECEALTGLILDDASLLVK